MKRNSQHIISCDSEGLKEYWVELIVTDKVTVSGKLFSFENKVVFETYGEHEGKLEIPVAKAKLQKGIIKSRDNS